MYIGNRQIIWIERIDDNNNNDRNMRSNYKLIIKKANTNFQRMSFPIGAPKIWNEIPVVYKEIGRKETFTSELSQYQQSVK